MGFPCVEMLNFGSHDWLNITKFNCILIKFNTELIIMLQFNHFDSVMFSYSLLKLLNFLKKKIEKKKLRFIVFHDFDGVRILCHSFVSEFHWSIFEFEYSHKVTEEVFCFDQWRCINLILSSSECSLAETIWFFFLIYRLFKQEISEFRQVFFGKMAWSRTRLTQILSVRLLYSFISMHFTFLL